ncbi:MAG: hypothetical protein WDN06_18385, partial [Asticcacaulis sp.]
MARARPWADEFERAAILQFDPDGKNRKVFAQGIRNCVGMAIQPQTGSLLCSNNERDYIGDDLPPDFFTRVPQGSFFGWPSVLYRRPSGPAPCR